MRMRACALTIILGLVCSLSGQGIESDIAVIEGADFANATASQAAALQRLCADYHRVRGGERVAVLQDKCFEGAETSPNPMISIRSLHAGLLVGDSERFMVWMKKNRGMLQRRFFDRRDWSSRMRGLTSRESWRAISMAVDDDFEAEDKVALEVIRSDYDPTLRKRYGDIDRAIVFSLFWRSLKNWKTFTDEMGQGRPGSVSMFVSTRPTFGYLYMKEFATGWPTREGANAHEADWERAIPQWFDAEPAIGETPVFFAHSDFSRELARREDGLGVAHKEVLLTSIREWRDCSDLVSGRPGLSAYILFAVESLEAYERASIVFHCLGDVDAALRALEEHIGSGDKRLAGGALALLARLSPKDKRVAAVIERGLQDAASADDRFVSWILLVAKGEDPAFDADWLNGLVDTDRFSERLDMLKHVEPKLYDRVDELRCVESFRGVSSTRVARNGSAWLGFLDKLEWEKRKLLVLQSD